MKVKTMLNIVIESAPWTFGSSSFHNLDAEFPKRRFLNHMVLILFGTGDLNTVNRKDLLDMYALTISHRYR